MFDWNSVFMIVIGSLVAGAIWTALEKHFRAPLPLPGDPIDDKERRRLKRLSSRRKYEEILFLLNIVREEPGWSATEYEAFAGRLWHIYEKPGDFTRYPDIFEKHRLSDDYKVMM